MQYQSTYVDAVATRPSKAVSMYEFGIHKFGRGLRCLLRVDQTIRSDVVLFTNQLIRFFFFGQEGIFESQRTSNKCSLIFLFLRKKKSQMEPRVPVLYRWFTLILTCRGTAQQLKQLYSSLLRPLNRRLLRIL